MKLQVLVSTMNQNDLNILDKMNLKSDAIIVNQCDNNVIEKTTYKGYTIDFISLKETGVGLSRNNALMRSSGDICLMADDDMVYKDNYKEIVLEAFKKNPKADIILFNVPIHKKNGQIIKKVKKNQRIRFYNAMKFGTVNIAFKKEKIFKKNIFFSLLFGGGARYGSGEDSIFIIQALKSGLKIYSNTEEIANIEENTSTWFEGYNEKYFFDRGALFEAIGGFPFSYLLIVQFLVRKRRLYKNNLSFRNALKKMNLGVKSY